MEYTLEEQALSVLIRELDPHKTILPIKLARVSRFLRKVGISTHRTKIETYLRWVIQSDLHPGAGLSVTNGVTPNAIITHLTPLLANIGPHGAVFCINQPVVLYTREIDGSPEDKAEMVIEFDSCREYTRRMYEGGMLHGATITIHTCNEDAETREVRCVVYEKNARVKAYRIFRSEHPARAADLLIEIGASVTSAAGPNISGIVKAAHCTRAWRRLCGPFTDEIRLLYELYMVDALGPSRLFDDRLRLNVPPHLQQMFSQVWMV